MTRNHTNLARRCARAALPDGTVPSSRGTPTRSISVGCDDGAFRVPKESLAEGVSLNPKPYTLHLKL